MAGGYGSFQDDHQIMERSIPEDVIDYEAQQPEKDNNVSPRSKSMVSIQSILVVIAIAIVCAFVYVSNIHVFTSVGSQGPVSLTKDEDIVRNRMTLPDINDPDAMHDFIKTNYLLYSGYTGDMAASNAQPKAKDDPNRTPETSKGAREAKKEVITSNNYLYIESFTDPMCTSSSFTGFFAFQINTCTPAWMFSYDEQKLWLKNSGSVKETKIITQTDLFSDETCSTPVTIKPVNQTTNQACGAWNTEGNTFVKFSLKETIPLEQYGSGVLIQSHPDEDCSGTPSEILYLVSRTAECEGRLMGVCGDDEVSLTRYNDYGCQGGKVDGYPMSFTKTCAYSNSMGFAKYGYATCNTADAPETIMTVESIVKFVGSEFKEGDDDSMSELTKKEKKKLAKLEKKLKIAEKKGKSDKVIAKLEKKIEKAGGTITNNDEEDVEETSSTVISDEAVEVMRLSKIALQNEVADTLNVEPQNVEIVGEHYDSKGNNGFALKYQVVGLDDADLDKAAKKAASKKLAKSIQKAIKKEGITGFEVQKGETSISELVPTDFYEEEIIAASKAIGKVTNIAEDSHELVSFDETEAFASRDTETQPVYDGKSDKATKQEWIDSGGIVAETPDAVAFVPAASLPVIDTPVDTAKIAYDAALQSAKAAAAAAAAAATSTTGTTTMTSSVTLPAVVPLPNTMIKTASAFGQNEPSTSHASGHTTQKIASSANQATSTAPIPQHTASTITTTA